MRWLRFAILIIAATILQTSLIDMISVTAAEIKPDVLLILLVFFAIFSNPTNAVISSFTIGFAADIIGPTMGPRMISFGVFGILLADLHQVIEIRKMPHQSFAIFMTGFLTAALAFFLSFLKAEPTASGVATELLWKPIYSAIVGPILFLPTAWFMRIGKRRMRRF
jgi:rod shape-determining protein MreD